MVFSELCFCCQVKRSIFFLLQRYEMRMSPIIADYDNRKEFVFSVSQNCIIIIIIITNAQWMCITIIGRWCFFGESVSSSTTKLVKFNWQKLVAISFLLFAFCICTHQKLGQFRILCGAILGCCRLVYLVINVTAWWKPNDIHTKKQKNGMRIVCHLAQCLNQNCNGLDGLWTDNCLQRVV